MKLVLQIALGVFLGALPALFVLDAWQNHQQALVKAEAEKQLELLEQNRLKQSEQLRDILQKNQRINPPSLQPNTE